MECYGCVTSLWQFVEVCNNPDYLSKFLIDHGVIKSMNNCPNCHEISCLYPKTLEFRCDIDVMDTDRDEMAPADCKFRTPARLGTWFAGNGLEMGKVCQLVYFWLVLPYPKYAFIMDELNISYKTMAHWGRCCREVCNEWLQRYSTKLGEEGHTVELDVVNVPYSSKKDPSDNVLVGGYERETGNCFIECIQKSDKDGVVNAVEAWVIKGTTLISSKLSSAWCQELEDRGFKVRAIQRDRRFVDPKTGDHTQTMTRLWRELRTCIPSDDGCHKSLAGYIGEYMFKRRYPDHTERAHAFFSAVASIHPPQ